MGATVENLGDVARLIQLAVAPIFLLSAIATTLLVFAGRLARIVDRGRALEAQPATAGRDGELRTIERRARLIYRALTMGVSAALGVCLLMTLVFAGALLEFNTAKPVALLFLLTLFTYTAALVLLLREVFLALGSFGLKIKEETS